MPATLRLRELLNAMTLVGLLFAGFGGVFAWAFDPGLLEDDPLENVLYDPERPDCAAAAAWFFSR